MKLIVKGCLVSLAIFSAISASSPVNAFPEKSVRLTVGFGPGGPSGIAARFMQKRFTAVTGQELIKRNKVSKENLTFYDDIKKVVELLVEYRPIVKYYTQYEYHGYSQTNETSLNLRKVGWEFEDNEIEDFDYHNGFGEYDENKPSYHDDVYECDINTLKLDSFIEMINNYIHLRGEDYDDWSCDTFFEWFQEIDKKQIIDEIPISIELPPQGISSVKIDKDNGELAKRDSKNLMFEYFLEENIPN